MDRLLNSPMTRNSKARLRENIDGLVAEFRVHLTEYESYKIRSQRESEIQRDAIIELCSRINTLETVRPAPVRSQACSHCRESGHNISSCLKRKTEAAALNR